MASNKVIAVGVFATNNGVVQKEHEGELHPVSHSAPMEDPLDDLIDRKIKKQTQGLRDKVDGLETKNKEIQGKLDVVLDHNRFLEKSLEEICRRFSLEKDYRGIADLPLDKRESEMKRLIALLPKAKQTEFENGVEGILPGSKSNWLVVASTALGACAGAGAGAVVAFAVSGPAAPVVIAVGGLTCKATTASLITKGAIGLVAGGCAFGGLGYATEKCSTT